MCLTHTFTPEPPRCLAAVWPQRRLLQYYDSLGAGSACGRVLGALRCWMERDAQDKGVALGEQGDGQGGGWRVENLSGRIPKQVRWP